MRGATSAMGAKKDKKDGSARGGRIVYKPWDMTPVYEKASVLDQSGFVRYRVKSEETSEECYPRNEPLRFFPLKFEHHTHKKGLGVDTCVMGVLDNGTTTCLRLQGFYPHMYAAIPPDWLQKAYVRGHDTDALVRAVFVAFRKALTAHVASNPALLRRFKRLDSVYVRDLFEDEDSRDERERTLPWIIIKDSYGFNATETQVVMNVQLTDPRLCGVALGLWNSPTGIPEGECALCSMRAYADEKMLSHDGCSAAYHGQCLSEWFAAEKARGVYRQGKRMRTEESLARLVELIGDSDAQLQEEYAKEYEQLLGDVEVWVENTPGRDDAAETADETANKGKVAALQASLDDCWDEVLDRDDAASDDESSSKEQQGQPSLLNRVRRRIKECDPHDSGDMIVDSEWAARDEQVSLGSCPCCRSLIYELELAAEVSDEGRGRPRVRIHNWWHEQLEPALWDIGLRDLEPPKPVDLLGEEEVYLANLNNTIRPRPRVTVYDGKVDMRYQLFTERKLEPATWWQVDSASLETVAPDSNNRVSTLPLELTVNYRDVQTVERILDAYDELPSEEKPSTEPQSVAKNRSVLRTRPQIVEMCWDGEMCPKTAQYRDKTTGEVRNSLRGTGFPTPEENPVLNIGVVLHNHGTGARKKIVFALDQVSRSGPDMAEFCKDVELLEFRNERTMLSAYVQMIAAVRPLVISSYNGAAFDHPYVMERCRHLGIRNGEYLGSVMRGQASSWRTALSRGFVNTTLQVPGVFKLDYLQYAQRNITNLRSHNLNTVAETFLKERKLDMPYTLIPEYQQTPEKRAILAQYVIKDALLPLRFGLKLNALEALYAKAKLSHATPSLLMTRKSQYLIDAFTHFDYHEAGKKMYGVPYMIPTITLSRKGKYEGAIVFPPKRGMYRAVYPQNFGRVQRQLSSSEFDSLFTQQQQQQQESEQQPSLRPQLCDDSIVPKSARAEELHESGRIQPVPRSSTSESQLDATSNIAASGEPGITATLDYASLYPAVIDYVNLCPTTYITKSRLAKFNMCIGPYPFMATKDITDSSERTHEILHTPTGETGRWSELDLRALRRQLKRAIELDELRDDCKTVTNPALRKLYYDTVGVWSRPAFSFDLETGVIHLHADSDTPMFVTERVRRGVLPETELRLRKHRVKVKDQMKVAFKKLGALRALKATGADTQKAIEDLEFELVKLEMLQLAIKLIMNTFYGYFGAPTSRMSLLALAETIPLIGQYFVMTAAVVAQTRGSPEFGYQGRFQVVYGDTDSVFIHMPMRDPFANTKIYMMNVSKHMCNIVTSFFPGARMMKLEFEKIFLWILLIAPKNYIGLKLEDNGKLSRVLSGVRSKRRDSNKLQAMVVNKAHQYIQEDRAVAFIDYVGELLEEIYMHNIPASMLSQSTSFSKNLNDPDFKPNAASVVAHKRFAYNGQLTEPGERFAIIYREPTYAAQQSEKSKRWSYKAVVAGINRAEDLAHALKDPTFRYDAEHYAASLVQSVLPLLIAFVPQPSGVEFNELRNMKWLLDRWARRPFFVERSKLGPSHHMRQRNVVDHKQALTRFFSNRKRCMLCKKDMQPRFGIRYATPRGDKTGTTKSAASDNNDDGAHSAEFLTRRELVLVDPDAHGTQQTCGAQATAVEACTTAPTPSTVHNPWEHELQTSMDAWDSSDLESRGDECGTSDSGTGLSILNTVQLDTLDVGAFVLPKATTSYDADTGVLLIAHRMVRQKPEKRAIVPATNAPPTHDALQAHFGYRCRSKRERVEFRDQWTSPLDTAVMPVCDCCVRNAVLSDGQSAALWKRAFRAPDLTEATYDMCVRGAYVLEILPTPAMQDRWRVLFVLTKFGVRRQRTHALTAIVAPHKKETASALHQALRNAIASSAAKWAVCSTCASINRRQDDVMACATIECANNGLRAFAQAKIGRVRRSHVEYAW